ncbi:hypothetical protein H4219_003537 [Mycoemilia scoparia]|uniref:Uncharacterized protein n=1 Tax=Mycoemilia scoparia TaxID=417184 RepID=A0A9W7ZUJ1_9FUNG|nr:hypothetical protein H4219_003537 [Mycoemilia scoparia]
MASENTGLVTAYVALTSMALGCIYLGTTESIKKLKSNYIKKEKKDGDEAEKHKERKYQEYSDDEGYDPEYDIDDEDEDDVVSSQDAYMFPVFGSATLFGLYMVFKWFDPSLINLLLRTYLAVLGVGGLTAFYVTIIKRLTGIKLPQFQTALVFREKELFFARFTALHLVSFVLAAATTGLYLYSKFWILNNLLGIAFSVTAISLIRLDSFKTGMIMLAGLFLYDIFWVFGTNVMVTVAKSFDAPIKVLFPKEFTLTPAKNQLTLLGLGDIVVPGVFVALAYRYDRHVYLQSIGYDKTKSLPAVLNGKHFRFTFPTPYFSATFAAYTAGLATTMGVMHVFKAAQPALLYLSPACILSVLITAFLRGELSAVMSFTDVDESAKDKDDDKKSSSQPSSPNKPKNKTVANLSLNKSKTPQLSQGEDADDEQEGVKHSHILDEKINPVPSEQSALSSSGESPEAPSTQKKSKKKKASKK